MRYRRIYTNNVIQVVVRKHELYKPVPIVPFYLSKIINLVICDS